MGDTKQPDTIAGKKFDLCVHEIKELKRNLGQNVWMLGRRLQEVKESGLFYEKYGTFEEFLEREVDIAHSTAYVYMQLAREFSMDLMEKWGINKCRLIVMMDKQVQEEFFQKHSPDDKMVDIKKGIRSINQSHNKYGDIDFFLDTERLGLECKEKLQEWRNHYDASVLKEDFNFYRRKDIIKQQMEEFKNEICNCQCNRK